MNKNKSYRDKDGIKRNLVTHLEKKREEELLKEEHDANKIPDVFNEKNKNNENDSKENKKNNNVAKKGKYSIKPRSRKILVSSKIADLIIKNNYIKYINSDIYVYFHEFGYFKILPKHEFRVFIRLCLMKMNVEYTRSNDIEDIIYTIQTDPRIQIDAKIIERKSNLVNTLSGVYDIKNEITHKHNPEHMFFNVLYAKHDVEDYKEKFGNSSFNKFLNDITLGDKELKKRLKEIAGYCLSNVNKLRQFYILLGEGSNGKSVFLNILSSLIGEENISNVQINQLSDQRYVHELFGKIVNIGSELSDLKLKDTSTIKSLVDDTDKIICKPVYKQPFSFTNYCKLIFATNNLPEMNSKGYKDNTAFFNRAVIIPFNNTIPKEKQDKDLLKKLKKEKDLILCWALEGLTSIRNNDWNLSPCRISDEYTHKYKNSQSLIERFIEERLIINKDEDYTIFKSDIRVALEEFYEDEGGYEDVKSSMKYLHNIIVEKYRVIYRKIRIKDKTKYGYIGVEII
ncbi:phage/plasmid primase, P4 family [Clostridium intestinale]|uniref:DNA primase family protein n=1 Tax=Clostridium intestinale TaxID=36845 RepID=UPI0028ED5C3F|nr:phage/plasmid primase, P4 family [Clostridium intestinale]